MICLKFWQYVVEPSKILSTSQRFFTSLIFFDFLDCPLQAVQRSGRQLPSRQRLVQRHRESESKKKKKKKKEKQLRARERGGDSPKREGAVSYYGENKWSCVCHRDAVTEEIQKCCIIGPLRGVLILM